VANIASFVLLQTNAIADLGGHALAEFHFISSPQPGGSLVSELSRRLGTKWSLGGPLTTLDLIREQ